MIRKSKKIKKKTMLLGDLVLITWVDIYDDGGEWKSRAKIKSLKPVEVQTVGWIAHETDDYINFVTSCFTGKDPEYSGGISIPRGCIKKIQKLKEVK